MSENIELVPLPSAGEIDLVRELDRLLRRSFYVQHRLTEAELQYAADKATFFLRDKAARELAHHAVSTGKFVFRELSPREADSDRDPYERGGKTYRGRLTVLHEEDANRLETILRKLMEVYGPRIRLYK